MPESNMVSVNTEQIGLPIPDILPRQIKSVGVELEGFFTDAQVDTIREHEYNDDRRNGGIPSLESDISISNTEYGEWSGYDDALEDLQAREVVTPNGGLKEWSKLEGFVTAYHPYMTNWSCGLHVHIGCTKAQHREVYDKKYYRRMVNALDRLSTSRDMSRETGRYLRNRLELGRSVRIPEEHYHDDYFYPCKPNTFEDYGCHHGKFYHINYGCWYEHRPTVEVRILPGAYNAKEALRMVHTVLDVTSAHWEQAGTTRKE